MTAKQIVRHDVNTADVRLNEVITGDNGQIIALVSGQPEYVDVDTVVPFATVSEAQAGTATDKAVTPAGLPLRVESNALVRQDGYGGNARGDGAVDLQRKRSADTQVASGANAVIAGGAYCTASGDYSTVAGGLNNAATAASSVTLGGSGNTASGNYSSVVGGNGNTASNGYATVGGGMDNTASGYYSVVCGGEAITVSGMHSVVLGGRNLTVSGDRSFAIGAPSGAVTLSADDANYVYGLRSFLSAPATAPTDADLVEAGSITFYLDETANALKCRARYSDGTTLKTGTVTLT